jgi:hypothetical protein|tara:strand:- start:158 stop:475 length:318 start_codon:yes stop_codon:yes gene_type:complete
MKSERFTAGSLFIERTRMREGPPVVYICKSGFTSKSFTDTKQLLAFIRWPKSTPTGTAIRDWLASFEQKAETPAPELDVAQLQREGFGPECHDPENPTANVKMVI